MDKKVDQIKLKTNLKLNPFQTDTTRNQSSSMGPLTGRQMDMADLMSGFQFFIPNSFRFEKAACYNGQILTSSLV
jgi:hypothetical protein